MCYEQPSIHDRCVDMCALIVIEGIDGSGKTTQAKLLFKKLVRRNYRVALLAEPTNSLYGIEIRKKLMTGNYTAEELYQLFVKDRILNANRIRKLMKLGYVVILDRYYMSTIAYQGAQGIPIDKILRDHINVPKPDIIIILDIDPRKALNRLKRKDTFEKIDFLERVRKIYLEIPKILSRYGITIKIIDADRDPEKISREILAVVCSKIHCKV